MSVRKIGIFFGLIVFELPYNLAVVVVAVWFVVLIVAIFFIWEEAAAVC